MGKKKLKEKKCSLSGVGSFLILFGVYNILTSRANNLLLCEKNYALLPLQQFYSNSIPVLERY